MAELPVHSNVASLQVMASHQNRRFQFMDVGKQHRGGRDSRQGLEWCARTRHAHVAVCHTCSCQGVYHRESAACVWNLIPSWVDSVRLVHTALLITHMHVQSQKDSVGHLHQQLQRAQKIQWQHYQIQMSSFTFQASIYWSYPVGPCYLKVLFSVGRMGIPWEKVRHITPELLNLSLPYSNAPVDVYGH